MPAQGSSFELLREPLFRRLWASVELSFLGLFIHAVAGAWLMATLTPSATPVALIQTAQALPIALFSLIAGALADTFDKRRTMIAALIVALTASTALAGLALAGALAPWSLLLLIFIVGTGVAAFTPAWQASLGDIVSRDRLPMAVSLHSIGANLMRTLGPSLGGVLVATVGVASAFAVAAASYLPASVVLAHWSPDTPADEDHHPLAREGLWSAIRAAPHYLSVTPHVQGLLLRAFLYSVSAASVLSLLPVVAKDQLQVGAGGYGLLFGSFGVGAILVGVLQPRLRQRCTTDGILRGAYIVHALCMAGLAVTTAVAPAFAALMLSGGCWLTVHSLHNSHLQLSTPRWIAGRMVALLLTATFTGIALGSYLWGLAADHFGLAASLCAAAVTMGLTLAVALRLPLAELSELSLEPLSDAGGRPAPVDLAPRLGPVHIQLRHRIAPDRVGAFKQLMNRRRRHLTRLGARQWTLMRDLEQAEFWAEQFQLDTWEDYQRMMKRRTAETVELRTSLRAMQSDGREPRVTVLCRSRVDDRVIEPVVRT